MAICTMCRQEMRTAQSCVAWKVPTTHGDVPVVPYGREQPVVDLDDGWGESSWDDDGFDDGHVADHDDQDDREDRNDGDGGRVAAPPGPAMHVWSSERCGDCRVRRGGTHHPGCDVAECPVCHQQLLSCGCWDSSVDDRELDARYGAAPPTAADPPRRPGPPSGG